MRTGGTATERGGRTYFAPTVVSDVPLDSELFCEESFLPIVSVVAVGSDDEAVDVANRTRFGLNGSVFSGDRRRAEALASRLVAGGVNVNDALQAGLPSLPFGGERDSGFGRLQGDQAFVAFSRAKTVVSDRFGGVPSSTALVFTSERRLRPTTIARAARIAFGRP